MAQWHKEYSFLRKRQTANWPGLPGKCWVIGRTLANALGEPLLAAVLGSGVQHVAQEAIYHGADTVYVADAPALAQYQTASYTTVMAQIAAHTTPTVLLVGMSDNGRDLGPRLAFRLRTGLASDCVELTINGATKLLEATRPVSGGNAMATVVIEKARPQMATVRAKTMEPAARDETRQGQIEAVSVDIAASSLPVKIVERVKAEAAGVRLEDADIVISGGRGLKGGDDFYAVLEPCAKDPRWSGRRLTCGGGRRLGAESYASGPDGQNRQPETVHCLRHFWCRAAYGRLRLL